MRVYRILALGQLASGGRTGEEGEWRLAGGDDIGGELVHGAGLPLRYRQRRRSRSRLVGASGRREDRRPLTGLSCEGGGAERGHGSGGTG